MKPLLRLTLAMIFMLPAFGGRRPAVAVSPAAQDDVKIVFVGVTGSGSDAMVDAGAMSKVTKRVFGIRIEGTAATATLRAFLESHDGRSVIRIDGIALTTVPALIDAQLPVGKVTTHTIEIEVPASVPEGTIASAVRWEVATN
jgi:hypothetical protein